MSEATNQYAVYRLRRDLKETRAFRHQSYQYLQEHGLKVISDYYSQLYLAGFDPSMTRADLRRQLEKELPADSTGQTLDISDVLAITRSGITSAYYVDPDKLIALTGFFHIAETSESIITIDIADYQIQGRNGLWFAAEEIWIDGQNFFLMQSQKYGTNAAYAVLDKHGRQAAEDTTKGFTDEIIDQIRDWLRNKQVFSPDLRKTTDSNLLRDKKRNSSLNGHPSEYSADSEETVLDLTDAVVTRFHQTIFTATSGKLLRHQVKKVTAEINLRKPQLLTKKLNRKHKRIIPVSKRKSVLKQLREYQIKIYEQTQNQKN